MKPRPTNLRSACKHTQGLKRTGAHEVGGGHWRLLSPNFKRLVEASVDLAIT